MGALHSVVIPALFDAIRDPRGVVAENAVSSLESYTEYMGASALMTVCAPPYMCVHLLNGRVQDRVADDAILPYLDQLMVLYTQLLESDKAAIRETVVCGIGSAAHAAGQVRMRATLPPKSIRCVDGGRILWAPVRNTEIPAVRGRRSAVPGLHGAERGRAPGAARRHDGHDRHRRHRSRPAGVRGTRAGPRLGARPTLIKLTPRTPLTHARARTPRPASRSCSRRSPSP